MCPEKCVCGKDQISCLQLETSDQLKLSNDEGKRIQKSTGQNSTRQNSTGQNSKGLSQSTRDNADEIKMNNL